MIKKCLVIFCLAIQTFGTTIVVSRTSDEVVFGTDSKATYRNGGTETFRNICKISQKDNVYFAVLGISRNPYSGFDSFQLIRNMITPQKPISTLVRDLETVFQRELKKELAWQKSELPKVYEKTIEGGGAPLSFVMAGIEDHRPVFYARGFNVDGTILSETLLEGDHTFWIGNDVAIERFLTDQNRKKPFFRTAEETVRSLIQLEIDDPLDSRSVGGPIDMVRITATGASWIQRKDGC
jgi:hypothetical protein